jgi:hypothetical protein
MHIEISLDADNDGLCEKCDRSADELVLIALAVIA